MLWYVIPVFAEVRETCGWRSNVYTTKLTSLITFFKRFSYVKLRRVWKKSSTLGAPVLQGGLPAGIVADWSEVSAFLPTAWAKAWVGEEVGGV